MPRKNMRSRRNAGARNQQQQNNAARTPRNRGRRSARRPRRANRSALTLAGEAFLKCAFAPPDFNSDPGQGIPDSFEGKTLVRKDVTTNSLSITGTGASGSETFILVAPTPGIAYWKTTVAGAGNFPDSSSTWTPVYTPGFESLFGNVAATSAKNRAENVTAFRYASQNVGVYPNSNLMQFAGAITVWKIPLRMVQNTYKVTVPTSPPVELQQMTWMMNGLEGASVVSPDNYVGTFIEGCFSQTACNEPDFEFSPIIEGLSALPEISGPSNPDMQFGLLDGNVLGCGSMDGIVIRISTPKDAINSMVVKTWSCIEYRVNPSSSFFQSAKDSPAEDQVALQSYRHVAKEIPCAVPYHMNSNFWNRVQSILSKTLGFASMVPGPVGEVARGIGATTRALQSLWI